MVTVNDVPLPFRAGMTLRDALEEAAADLSGPVLVTCAGRFVAPEDYGGHQLADGEEIMVLRVISGG